MTTFTKKSISVSFSDRIPCTVTYDGNLILHLTKREGERVTAGAGAQLVGIRPRGYGVESLRTVAEIAPNGAHLDPGEAAVFASLASAQTAPGTHWDRPSYWSVPTRSSIAEMLAVVCVPWLRQPRDVLRPPAVGMSPTAIHMRSTPVFTDRINLRLLPSVIEDWTGPDFAYYERLFGDFSGDIYSGWSTDTRTPGLQHPGYGTAMAAAVSQALLMLCRKVPIEQKRRLAICLVQWGIDLAGAFSDGRDNSAVGGGHMAGRKALVVLAGHLLGEDPMRNPTAYIGKRFMEDNAFSETGWRHSDGAYAQAGPWSEQRLWPAMLKTNAMNYADQVTGAQIGTALAMKLMGLTPQMGVHHYEWCRAWMDDMTSDAHPVRACYAKNGVGQAWQTDYAEGGGVGECKKAWLRYRGQP